MELCGKSRFCELVDEVELSSYKTEYFIRKFIEVLGGLTQLRIANMVQFLVKFIHFLTRNVRCLHHCLLLQSKFGEGIIQFFDAIAGNSISTSELRLKVVLQDDIFQQIDIVLPLHICIL